MTRVLNQAIENVPDPHEQVALAMIAHLAPALGPWRQGEDLREERALLEQRAPGLGNELAALKNQIADLEGRAATAARAGDILGLLIGGALISVIGGVLMALEHSGPLFAAAILGFLGGIAAIVHGYRRLSQRRNAITAEKTQSERDLANKADEQKALQQRLTAIERELRSRDGGFPGLAVARVGFPIRRAQLVGFEALVDLSATLPAIELSTIDLSRMGTKLQTVSTDAKNVAAVPVLLAPSSQMTSDAVERLYGEEDHLRTLVDRYVETLSEIDDVKIRLPLVPAQSEIARRMRTADSTDLPDKSMVLLQADLSEVNKVAGFVSQVNAAKAIGESVLSELRSTIQVLQNACQSYSDARSTSINYMHAQVFEVLNKGSWCSKRFYCPRSILAPQYLQAQLQIEIAEAHELPLDDLMQRLKSDPVIARRIEEQREIAELLKKSYEAVKVFSSDRRVQTMVASGAEGVTAEPIADIQDQYEESVKHFRIVLLRAITGSTTPLLAFSSEARLFYDPEMEEWSSDVAPYTYTTADVRQFGQVLKVHTDLLFPLWERLWAEKADFRKSELFRTNESLNRMIEKESEKLIEIGNQFRADMRPVRENVYLIESDLKARTDELRQFRDTMGELGVLSTRQAERLSEERLQQRAMADVPLLDLAAKFEFALMSAPEMQAQLRGTERDPVDIARVPDVLISYSEDGMRAPRLPLLGAEL